MFQSVWRSLHNLKDVGVVQVKVIGAEGLMAADVTGKIVTLSPNNRTTTSAVVVDVVKVPLLFFASCKHARIFIHKFYCLAISIDFQLSE